MTSKNAKVSFKEKYGPVAIVAGASEGLGAAWARELAGKGLDLILIARRENVLQQFANQLACEFSIKVTPLICDLSEEGAAEKIFSATGGVEVGLMVYNATLSYIGPFIENSSEEQVKLATMNMITPLKLVHYYGKQMVERKRGGVILMSSLAGFQGSGFLSGYAASKAFSRVLAESLWYEWKDKGVDVIGCCAGATSTPNYNNTKPESAGFFAPKVQTPEEVVKECIEQLGKTPSYITGIGNRIASFFMHRVLSRKMAVNIMGDTTRKIYRIK